MKRRELIREALRLRRRLETAFSVDTAYPKNQRGYSDGPPSRGHCAAVAAIVWHQFGGQLVSAFVEGESHWFNRVRGGDRTFDLDITADQFAEIPVLVALADGLYDRTKVRSIVELDDETLKRAALLADRAELKETVQRLTEKSPATAK